MDESLAPPPRFQLDQAPSEITALVEFLDIHRLEFHERVWGLTDEQLRQTAAASDLTLGALIKHMALVEHTWFEHRFLGMEEREPWASAPWEDDEDWELTTAANDTGDELFRLYVDACNRCRDVIANAESLNQLSVGTDKTDKPWNLRWIMIHMIEEYARHLGHADIIREAIDGTKG
jgi:uncharacterized damage-inducible protein DinB